MENDKRISLLLQRSLVEINVSRINVFAWIWLYIVLVISIVHYSELFFSKSEQMMVGAYSTIHIVLFYLHIAALLFSWKKKNSITIENMKIYEYIVLIYIHIILFSTMLISILDIVLFKHAVIYEISFLIVCMVFLFPLKKVAFGAIFTFSAISITTYNAIGFNGDSISIFLALLLLGPMGLIIQHHLYKIKKQTLLKQLLLNEEVQKTKKLTEQLKTQSFIDPLTTIPNRRAFHEHVQSLPEGEPLTVMMIDIDYFKEFNDFYGHIEGDYALREVALYLQDIASRNEAFIARWGGEEFILLSHINEDEAVELCQQILKKTRTLDIPHEQSKVAPYITFSIGICYTNSMELNKIEEYYLIADRALYKVKEQGRDDYYFINLEEMSHAY